MQPSSVEGLELSGTWGAQNESLYLHALAGVPENSDRL